MKRAGYTLLESLLVLFLCSLIFLVSQHIQSDRVMKGLNQRLFTQTLSSEIEYAQAYAIMQRQRVSLMFIADTSQLLIRSSDNGLNKQIDLGEEWQCGNTARMTYTPQGHIGNYRSVYFVNSKTNERLILVFQLGSGKFEWK